MKEIEKTLPTENDWNEYPPHCDEIGRWEVAYLRKDFFGKTWQGMVSAFSDGRCIGRSEEFFYCPSPVFQYYIKSYYSYLLSEASRGDADAASVFLGLIDRRYTADPDCITEISGEIAPVLEFLSVSQERFNASDEIYGSFSEKVTSLLSRLPKYTS